MDVSDSDPDPVADDGDVAVRQARADDREAVVAFTENTWPELDGDYIPRVFDEWVETDGPRQRTFVAVIDERPVGICQGVLLSDHEAWAQGMRVDPGIRGQGVSPNLTRAVFRWAADAGATVCRNMVFAWNAAGLGQSRAMGFEPVTEFRWLEPTADVDATPELTVRRDPAAAWTHWRRSDACGHLAGLTLDLEETWALAELTRERLQRVGDAVLTVADDRTRGMTYRVRTFERETDEGDPVQWAEYGVGAWTDHAALRSLAAAVARDAADVGADRARVLIPETPRHISDAAYARVAVADDADFVLERELTVY